MTTLSERDMRNILRHRCEEAGGQKAWAVANGVSPQHVSDILNGRRNVSAKIAKLVGYSPLIRFSALHSESDTA